MATQKRETSAEKKKAAEAISKGRLSLHNLYDECNAHMRALDFYKEELKYLEKRLSDIAKGNSNETVLAQVEQFQNQFIILKDNLAEARHTINGQLKNITKLIRQKPTHADEKTINESSGYSKDIHDLEKNYAGLKLKFNKFLAKYL